MVEPPSRRLQQILLGLKLCSPRELRRCASRVKVLSADLPAFDSVWLDALVQRRVLTSWQAQTIELDQPELLRIGPCIIEDRIGQSHGSSTYLARLPGQKPRCVIKRVIVPSELRRSVTDRLKQVIEKSQVVLQDGALVPHSVSDISSEPLPQLASSEKLRESAATRASRQTSTASATSKRSTQSGVGRPRRKSRPTETGRSGKLTSELAIVSRWVDGLSLSEILLRRGRLPSSEVDGIARQLLESLAALHEAGIVHGEILLSNIRLTSSGQSVLVDAGVRPALQPEFQINAHASPEKNDGIAPELIGTGALATPRSDLYALGCALWQALAGRPAFPTGDPLSRLASHQTERLPDIREFAPDTSDRLAAMIEWLTEPSASQRPRNASEVLADGIRDRASSAPKKSRKVRRSSEPTSGKTLKAETSQSRTAATTVKPAGRATRRRLSKFAASFHQPVRRTTRGASPGRTAKSLACACAAMAVAIVALFTLDARSRNFVLASLPQRVASTINSEETASESLSSPATSTSQNTTGAGSGNSELTRDSVTEPSRSSPSVLRADSDQTTEQPGPHQPQKNQRLPLPEPDPYGLVLLTEPGVYEAGSISWPGSHLILRGMAGLPISIVVAARPLQLRATEVTLENIELRLESASAAPNTMVQIRSQKLTCRRSGFLSPLSESDGLPAATSDVLSTGQAIQWMPIDSSDPLAGELSFDHCRLVGSHSSILLASPGRKIRCTNTLKLGGGALFVATGRAASGDNMFELEQTTLRGCGSLLEIDLRNAPPWKSQLTVKPVSSVFDLRRRSGNDAESLITFVGGQLQLAWHERVSFDGDSSIAGSTVGLASWRTPDGNVHQVLDAAEVSVRGLMQTDFKFHGPPDSARSNSVLVDVQTNRLTSRLPGISNSAGTVSRKLNEDMLLIGPEISPGL